MLPAGVVPPGHTPYSWYTPQVAGKLVGHTAFSAGRGPVAAPAAPAPTPSSAPAAPAPTSAPAPAPSAAPTPAAPALAVLSLARRLAEKGDLTATELQQIEERCRGESLLCDAALAAAAVGLPPAAAPAVAQAAAPADEEAAGLARALRLRGRVAGEVIQTEKSYLAALEALVEAFSVPLSPLAEAALLTREQHRAIFQNAPELSAPRLPHRGAPDATCREAERFAMKLLGLP